MTAAFAILAPDAELCVPRERETYPQGWLRQLVEPCSAVLTRGARRPLTYPPRASGRRT
jgi:hypothetical protein